jgi:hypothetical protein
MAFRMNCVLCSRSALVLTRRDANVSYQVDCPKCGRYRLSNSFAKHYALHPEALTSLSEKKKASYQALIRHAAAADRTFTFQWQDIQRPLQ